MNKLLQWVKKLFQNMRKTIQPLSPQKCTVSRKDHPISRSFFSKPALIVLNRLRSEGYQSYLVGGAVRDLLQGESPKDFDIVTNATPEELRNLFRNSRIIGRRFRLTHVYFGKTIIEIATFRRASIEDRFHSTDQVRTLARDNTYGTIAEDAFRRDFTINAIYYNFSNFTLEDYVGGIDDIRTQTIRLIGEPSIRHREDPARILRALRFLSRPGFQLESQSEKAISRALPFLKTVPNERLFYEMDKLFNSAWATSAYSASAQYDLLRYLLPGHERIIKKQEKQSPIRLLVQALLTAIEDRKQAGKTVSLNFLLATLLWPCFEEAIKEVQEAYPSSANPFLPSDQIFRQACQSVFKEQSGSLPLSKKLMLDLQTIWRLQKKLGQLRSKPSHRLAQGHPYFKTALGLLRLRGLADQAVGQKHLLECYSFWSPLKVQATLCQKSFSSTLQTKRHRRRQ